MTVKQIPRTQEQLGPLVYEILKAIADQKLTSSELSVLQPIIFSGHLDMEKLVGKGKLLTKLFGVARALDEKFPLFVEESEDQEDESDGDSDADNALAASIAPAAPAKDLKPQSNDQNNDRKKSRKKANRQQGGALQENSEKTDDNKGADA